MPAYEYCSAIGQDSHRFVNEIDEGHAPGRKLILGGIHIQGERALEGNSDADVILHALTNAVSGISGVNILGARSDRLCLEEGIKDSAVYLKEALATLGRWQLTHISISVEGRRPKFAPVISAIRSRLADLTGLQVDDIGLTATSGEGLTAFGRGEGLQAFVIVTARRAVIS